MPFLSHYLVQVGSFAKEVDGVILIITLLTGFWFLVAEGVFFGLLAKFAAQPGVKAQYITGEERHQKRWVAWPHHLVLVCDVIIIVAALRVWYHVKQELPPPDRTVRVISQQWAWTFVDPGPDNQLDTPDDIRTVDELHVELNKTYHFELQSRDVLHSFSVPVFRLKQDALPGRTIRGWFKAERTGTYDIQCAEICGIGHGLMPARLVVETPEAHADWLKAHASVASAAPAGK
jgi:cytochrome c oxidase subunit 2